MAYEPYQDSPDPGADEREPVVPEREPGNRPDGEPGNELLPPDAESPPGEGKGWFLIQTAEKPPPLLWPAKGDLRRSHEVDIRAGRPPHRRLGRKAST